ncbi:MAG: hypothetical protein KJS98_02335, partial [Nitrospirae bacterium]|nr:hypothetical protein [Nitrospirota bacterium]
SVIDTLCFSIFRQHERTVFLCLMRLANPVILSMWSSLEEVCIAIQARQSADKSSQSYFTLHDGH